MCSKFQDSNSYAILEDASRKNSIPTASGSILGKREERPIVIDDGDEAYPSAKRMRSDVDFPARGPSTDASLPYIIVSTNGNLAHNAHIFTFITIRHTAQESLL